MKWYVIPLLGLLSLLLIVTTTCRKWVRPCNLMPYVPVAITLGNQRELSHIRVNAYYKGYTLGTWLMVQQSGADTALYVDTLRFDIRMNTGDTVQLDYRFVNGVDKSYLDSTIYKPVQ